MTYYLVRHVIGWGEESIPYTAGSSMEAIRIGRNLHAPRAMADYAQIKDHTGKVIATLPGNQTIEKAREEYNQLTIKFDQDEILQERVELEQ